MGNLSLEELKLLKEITFNQILEVNKHLRTVKWSINDCKEALEDEEYIEDWLSYKSTLNGNTAKLEIIKNDIITLNELHTKLENIIKKLEEDI